MDQSPPSSVVSEIPCNEEELFLREESNLPVSNFHSDSFKTFSVSDPYEERSGPFFKNFTVLPHGVVVPCAGRNETPLEPLDYKICYRPLPTGEKVKVLPPMSYSVVYVELYVLGLNLNYFAVFMSMFMHLKWTRTGIGTF